MTANVLKKLEERIEQKMEERMGPLATKMDEMIRLHKEEVQLLKKIEENTRK